LAMLQGSENRSQASIVLLRRHVVSAGLMRARTYAHKRNNQNEPFARARSL
jgi:hypothetical protein